MVDFRQSEDGTFILSGLSREQVSNLSFAMLIALDEGHISFDEMYPITMPIDEFFEGDKE